MAKSKSTKGAGLIILLIIAASVAAFILSMTWLQSLAKTSTYYVLLDDVPAKTMIFPDMLHPVVTSEDTEPMNAITLEEVEESIEYGPPLITQIPLEAGDPIVYSVVSGYKDLSVYIPDSWVLTSFGVPADNAVGGRIRAGYYFDMLVTIDDRTYYPFVNMLALDTTISMDDVSSSDAVDTGEAYEGQTSQYVIGMPPGDAARLQNLMVDYEDTVRLVLSPRENEYDEPDLEAYTGAFTWNSIEPDLETDFPDPINMGEETGVEIDPGDRDIFGRPIEEPKNCSKGNMFVAPDENGECPVGGVAIMELEEEE